MSELFADLGELFANLTELFVNLAKFFAWTKGPCPGPGFEPTYGSEPGPGPRPLAKDSEQSSSLHICNATNACLYSQDDRVKRTTYQ